MDLVTLGQQKLGKVGPVLARDSSNQCPASHVRVGGGVFMARSITQGKGAFRLAPRTSVNDVWKQAASSVTIKLVAKEPH